MAELHVQRKRNNYLWFWLLLLVLVAAAATYFYTHSYQKTSNINSAKPVSFRSSASFSGYKLEA